MNVWVGIEELRNAVNLTQLTASQKDEELISYCLAAQRHAENYCKRFFDATTPKTEYFSSLESQQKLVVRGFPLLSVTNVKVDSSLAFSATSIVSSSDYFVQTNNGIIRKISGNWTDPYNISNAAPTGEDDIQVVYLGGYVPERDIVAEATPTSSHTIASQSAFYSQPFQIWVQSRVANAAGDVTITGTDESDASQTETITFPASTASVSAYRKTSRKSWKSITAVNTSALNTTGAKVKVVASSFPDALRQALCLHTAHLYIQDSSRTINVGGRTIESDSESGIIHEVPKEVLQLLNGFRQYQ